MAVAEQMDWGTIALFGALAMIAAIFSWRSDMRPVGLALLGQLIFCTIVVAIFGEPAEPAANAVGELIIILATGPVVLYRPILASTVLTLSTLSCCTTISRWAGPVDHQYEVTVNALLFLQCVVVINTDFWHVVGDSLGRIFRWHASRRRAVALASKKLASDQFSDAP